VSAIFGILRFDTAEVSCPDMERMSNVLAHRGPDGRKFAADGPIALGHCLTRVNNEDRFEAQPLYDREADLTLVADCRIDNREELAKQFGLSAADIGELPDSQFILRAYKRWGETAAEHLLGDFAFAVWDGRAKKLVLARDHMGQRCVHYHRGKGFLAFATEIKALWAVADLPRALNETQVGRVLLADTVPRGGETIFKEIVGLSGGTALTARLDGSISIKQYWEPHAASEHLGRDDAYYVESYRRILTEAVACRVRRLATPPALCFSAGYDSAAIAGLCGPPLRASGRKLITISSVLPENYSGLLQDVRPWVESCRREMPHLDVRYFVRDPQAVLSHRGRVCFIADDIPSLGYYVLDGMYLIAAKAGARLIMDGIGGDLTLNPRGGGIIATLLLQGRLRRVIAELGACRRSSGLPIWRILRSEVGGRLAPPWVRLAWVGLRKSDPRITRRFLAPTYAQRLSADRVANIWNFPVLRKTVPVRAANAQSLGQLAACPHLARSVEAAAHGLDFSRPMYDKRVVEFALAIPEKLQLVDGRARDLACRALAEIYPPEYQTRGRFQDPLDPDTGQMINAILPGVRGELTAMRNSSELTEMFALEAMVKVCGTLDGPRPQDRSEMLRLFNVASYLNWFRAGNR
jgi:asparagine synthase (glutamine-hydrolysing)